MTDPLPPLDILYEDGPCLAVLKPGGLLTQAPPEIDSLERRAKAFIKQRDAKPGNVYLGVPHRLDRPVSGVLVLALHARAAHRLSRQFQGRLIEKTYWALVEGAVQPSEGTWTDFIRKVPDRAEAQIVPAEHPDAREAILHYRVVGRHEGRSWLEIRLETGRMHQIRLQCGSRGFPILGDYQYGAHSGYGPAVEDERRRWIALHARQLAFEHPMTRRPVQVEAPVPIYWYAARPPIAEAF